MNKKKIKKIAEEKAFDYQRELGTIDSVSDDHVIARRMGFYDGFIDGAKWMAQQEQPQVDLEKEIDTYLDSIEAWQIQEAPFTLMTNIARHFAEWGRKQVLQEIYEGKVKPVDKITAAWLDNEPQGKEGGK